jgi:hypothetical protein
MKDATGVGVTGTEDMTIGVTGMTGAETTEMAVRNDEWEWLH